jgi:signal transduction histidine kinase
MTLTNILTHKDRIVELKEDIIRFRLHLLERQLREPETSVEALKKEYRRIDDLLHSYIDVSVYKTLEQLEEGIFIKAEKTIELWESRDFDSFLRDKRVGAGQRQFFGEILSRVDQLEKNIDTITLNQVKVFQTFYYFLLGMSIFAMFYFIGMRNEIIRRREAEKVSDNLSQKIISLRDEERNKVASELHDDIAQELSAALIYNSNRDYSASYEKIRYSLKQIRTLSHQLFSHDISHLGLVASIEQTANYIHTEYGTHFRVSTWGIEEERFSENLLLTVYHVCREAITNIGRHAAAENAEVKLTYAYPSLTIIIEDDGIGFDVENVLNGTYSEGIGLHSIKRRVEHLNGSFHINSSKKGTRMRVILPAAEDSAYE